MSLEKALMGVKATDIESPDDVEEVVVEEESSSAADTDVDDTDSTDSDDTSTDTEPGKKSERPVENVRRELLRKLDELERRNTTQIQQLGEIVKAALNASQAGGKKSASTMDDLSIDELRALRGQVPEESRAQFDAYYEERRIADAVEKQVSKAAKIDKYKTERDRSNEIAMRRYPQLGDKFSPLHAEVDRRLRALDHEVIEYNPRIILNLADDVAGEFGIVPRQTRPSRTVRQPDSISGRKPAAKPDESEPLLSDEKFEKLSKALAPALKGKREYDKKRIKERAAEYAKRFGIEG